MHARQMHDSEHAAAAGEDFAAFSTLFQFVPLARRNLTAGTWDYMMGGSESETTLWRNRAALESWALRSRVLNDVGVVDARTSLLGQPLAMPVLLAPIGSLQDICAKGGVAQAQAAQAAGIPLMLSSVCMPGVQEVAAASSSAKFFQLYVRGDAAWVDGRIAEAVDCGYSAICLTVDRACYGRRERDLSKAYRPTARANPSSEVHQARFTWADIERIRTKLAVPLILKGISTAEDARIAVDAGVDCIYVSNHGGRQLDHAVGSADALPEVVDAVGGRAELVLDGGVMRGTDVVKAIALGASAVGIGRLQCLALAAGGAPALMRLLEILRTEIETCLALMGLDRINKLGSEALQRAHSPSRNWLDGAFPLLNEGYGDPGGRGRLGEATR